MSILGGFWGNLLGHSWGHGEVRILVYILLPVIWHADRSVLLVVLGLNHGWKVQLLVVGLIAPLSALPLSVSSELFNSHVLPERSAVELA